ncbi:MAG: histidine phosphatase family protein [Nitriliruptoraceae bacterium]
MELLLVRHAQPEWNRGHEAQVDPHLTAVGQQQADRLAACLRGERFDEVLVSTARRARRTAAPLLESVTATRVEERAWMHEIHMPARWQGTPAEEVDRVMREARHRTRDAWWDGIPDGESFHDFHARVTLGLVNELAEHGVERDEELLWHVPEEVLHRRLLLVAHAGTNSVVLGHLLGFAPEPWEWERFASAHASVTVLRTTPIAGRHIFRLERFSDTSHLGELPVTR